MVSDENRHELQFDTGDLFLGTAAGYDIGIKTERHAITIAGARSGKGACVIIPNLLRWPHNVLVIDPKGENAEKTWEARQKMGKYVHVLDPFGVADVPDEIRASFNPLAHIDLDDLTAGSDLKILADGLVKRHDPKHAQWDDGAVKILAGIMAFAVADAPPEKRTLAAVREVLIQPSDALRADAESMMQIEGGDGLAKNAGLTILTALDSEKSIEAQFLNNARENTDWIDVGAFNRILNHSSFNLADIKTGNASVYLVLPPEYLDEYGGFLRLFVRTAINVMAKGGSGKGNECLFILDEFYSLGKIDAIATASGLMPSYGVHLWPILQNLGQLTERYGQEAAGTFFGNADVHQFFGNTDPQTLEHISVRLGLKSMDEIPLPPPPPSSAPSAFGQGISSLSAGSKKGSARALGAITGGVISSVSNNIHAAEQADYQNRMNIYNRAMAEHGKPRMAPDEIAVKVRKKDDVVADNMVCFVNGEPIWLKPSPYFRKPPSTPEPSTAQPTGDTWGKIAKDVFWTWIGCAVLGGWVAVGMRYLGLARTDIPSMQTFLGGAVGLGSALFLLVILVAWLWPDSQND